MRPIFTKVCVVLFAFAAVFCGNAGAAWVALDGGAEGTTSLRTMTGKDGETILQVDIPGFFQQDILIDGKTYATVSLPGHVGLLEKGLPALPMISRSFLIADRGEASFRILDVRYEEFPTAPIAPSKGNLLRSVDPRKVPWTFADLYRDGGVFPAAAVSLGDPFILRDHRGVPVTIHPFQYDADRGVLRVIKSVRISVGVEGDAGKNIKRRSVGAHGIDPQFRRVYGDFFVNYDDSTDKYTSIARPGAMLIICDDALQDAMAPFIEWKQQRGFPVEMISISSVGASATEIQAAITTRYESAEGLTYVILVGDIGQIPTNSGTVEGASSDPMYAMVDGDDSYPDLFISRLSAQDQQQAQVQVAKFIHYEKEPDTGTAGNWYKKAAGIASDEFGGTELADYERMNLLRDVLSTWNFTDIDEIYEGLGGSTGMIADALNEGRSLVNYIGHGSGTSWSSVPWSISDIGALANGWQQPWIVDVSCMNGKFSLDECFAEAWLRAGTLNQPAGAIASFSASTNSAWVPPTVMQTEVIDLLCAEAEYSLGSLYFSGAMKTLDEYPPASGNQGVQLVEQYNIFGDCSLVVRTDQPAAIIVSHAEAVGVGSSVFPIDTGVAGATVTLWRDGVLHGIAITDAGGYAEVPLDPLILDIGDVTLTVSAYNHVPCIEILPAIIPVDLVIEPATVAITVSTPVSITVADTLGAGMADVVVTIDGYGISLSVATTDVDGIVTFNINPLFGEILTITGREIGASFDLFSASLPVAGGTELAGASIVVSTPSINLDEYLVPTYPGLVEASTTDSGFNFFLDGCGLALDENVSGSTFVAEVVPLNTGLMTAVLARSGCNIFQTELSCVQAYGTLSGSVLDADDGLAPVTGVRVKCYPAGADTTVTAAIAELLTDVAGHYALVDSMEVGYFDIYVSKFGFLSEMNTTGLMYGANVFDIEVARAPAGMLSGIVTSASDSSPLVATIDIYLAGAGSPFLSTVSDETDGSYSVPDLPYFNYQLRVRATHFIPVNESLSIASAAVTRNFVMHPTEGNLLVIDDNARTTVTAPPKFGSFGELISGSYLLKPSRSAVEMVADLESMGYTVTTEADDVTDPATWDDYDVVILACGNNTSTVGATGLATALIARANAGGAIFVEGGEIAYNHNTDEFASAVLHVNDWNHDKSGSLTESMEDHYLLNTPNELSLPGAISYTGYGDQDAVSIALDAQQVCVWSTYTMDAGLVAYDPNPDPAGGQIVFMPFNYMALASGPREELLQNVITWLTVVEVGDCTVSGTATFAHQNDHAGIVITAQPGGVTVYTDADGAFEITGLFSGEYQILAGSDGYATAGRTVALESGQTVTDVELVLFFELEADFCDTPALEIPDNDAGGVDATMAIGVEGLLSGIEVFVDFTHTYIGDLKIDLLSPAGTTIRMHDKSGGSTDNLVGWYVVDLMPVDGLGVLIGEELNGIWTLHVSDNGPSDLGTLNEWCLRLRYPDQFSVIDDPSELPRVVEMNGNYPNPFNPATTIRFALPRDLDVELTVFDVRGRKVVDLVRGVLEAGRNEVTWYGRDEAGRRVCSGLYFYRLRADGKTITDKMLLLK